MFKNMKSKVIDKKDFKNWPFTMKRLLLINKKQNNIPMLFIMDISNSKMYALNGIARMAEVKDVEDNIFKIVKSEHSISEIINYGLKL